VTNVDWVQRALDAADQQLGHVAVEDDEVLTVIAQAMQRVEGAVSDGTR
jgi:hypothetical protein